MPWTKDVAGFSSTRMRPIWRRRPGEEITEGRLGHGQQRRWRTSIQGVRIRCACSTPGRFWKMLPNQEGSLLAELKSDSRPKVVSHKIELICSKWEATRNHSRSWGVPEQREAWALNSGGDEYSKGSGGCSLAWAQRETCFQDTQVGVTGPELLPGRNLSVKMRRPSEASPACWGLVWFRAAGDGISETVKCFQTPPSSSSGH